MIYTTALVTGATSGFGRAIALSLAKEGLNIIACGRRIERLKELAKENSKIRALELDVSDHEKVFEAAEMLKKEGIVPDILVNNAGLALGLENADDADFSNWLEMIDTNIKGALAVTRAFLPELKKKNSGYIINMGSVAASWPYAGGNTYGASKAFIQQFSRNLKTDLLGTNIRVTCIEPGMAETEFSIVRFKGDKDRASSVYKGVKPLTSEDIANIVRWLITQPEHLNVTNLEVMPTQQAWAGLKVERN